MIICRKCKKEFKSYMKIDGKYRRLHKRKFCIECSPFGSRNTKPDDPSRKSVFGQVNYKKKPYSQWSEKGKEIRKKHTYNYIHKKRLKALEMKNNKCSICSNNDIDCLTFHHKNREEKLFNLSILEFRKYSWPKIEKEVEKCILVCFNCHMKIESDIENLKEKSKQHIRGYNRKLNAIKKLGGKCSNCGYNECLRCLSFHHKNPVFKSFPLDIRSFCGYSLKRLQEEIEKCELLCLNCHAKLERSINISRHKKNR
jgi:hypothetical protein